MKILLRFLPKDIQNMIELGIRVFSALDTASERKAVMEYAIKMFDPDGPGGGRVTIAEWGTLGGKLRIMRGPSPKTKDV
jgi:hypothetical protein